MQKSSLSSTRKLAPSRTQRSHRLRIVIKRRVSRPGPPRRLPPRSRRRLCASHAQCAPQKGPPGTRHRHDATFVHCGFAQIRPDIVYVGLFLHDLHSKSPQSKKQLRLKQDTENIHTARHATELENMLVGVSSQNCPSQIC